MAGARLRPGPTGGVRVTHRIVTSIDRPPRETVAAFESFSAPLVSDVMGTGRGTMDAGIEPTFEAASVVGPAVTVDAAPGDNLVLHRALQLAAESDVLVVDADGYSEAGIWGELMSLTAQRMGVAGTVVDGGVRDVRETTELGYPLFTRHVSPKGSTKRQPGSINVPITCGGTTVSPGDVVVADADGVAVVPKSETEDVLAACRNKRDAEAEMRTAADTPAHFEDTFDEVLAPFEEADPEG